MKNLYIVIIPFLMLLTICSVIFAIFYFDDYSDYQIKIKSKRNLEIIMSDTTKN